MIKIKTRRTNLYPGDKKIQIQAVRINLTVGLMNLTPIYFNSKRQYENDINGYIFKTITEAKQYCKKNLKQLTSFNPEPITEDEIKSRQAHRKKIKQSKDFE